MNLVKKDMLDTVSGVAKQGIEPIDDELSQNYLYDNFNKRRLPMKTLLLDQTIISGLGNIYADEVLFEAKINPLKKGNEISIEECERIKNASKKIIEEAIKCGGTTIKSYTSSLGVTGRFQQHLQVHKRENEKCNTCGTIINRIVVGGRSTYYCSKCQK
jgi:formamidopyrimidine-DNA glycosylase